MNFFVFLLYFYICLIFTFLLFFVFYKLFLKNKIVDFIFDKKLDKAFDTYINKSILDINSEELDFVDTIKEIDNTNQLF